MTRRPRRSTRGLTLLEAVFSVLVLSTGVVAVFGMINRISSANRTMAYQAAALDAFARISAEIRDAKCVFPSEDPNNFALADIDPGIDGSVAPPAWQTDPVVNSTIRHVGTIPGAVPQVRVAYRVSLDPNIPPTATPAYDVEVRVRQIMGDPAKDDEALESGYWIQIYPVKKLCSLRPDATARGEY